MPTRHHKIANFLKDRASHRRNKDPNEMFDQDPSSSTANQGSEPDSKLPSLRILSFGVGAFLLCALAWVVPAALLSLQTQTPRWAVLATTSALLLVLHAALTWSAQRFLTTAFPMDRRPLAYRVALVLSAGVGWVRALTLAQLLPSCGALFLLLVDALGAVLGGFLSTTIEQGWVEHNYPPSEEIKNWVKRRHKTLLASRTRNPRSKRIFDIALAAVGLLLSAPLCVLISILIWFEDPGPILFIKHSVGRGGVNFHQYKFRTMIRGAEFDTGPILAQENDSRVLFLGRFLRKTALDELPQLLNILIGEMSFVGPRPQRTVLVQGYLERMPEFAERHAIRPGLAGLAQLVGSYHITPRQKLRFDRIYARHASLGFDLKLLALSFLLVFWLRWRNDWDGRIPRSWLRFGSRRSLG
jgi:lipopolysaccharide/colanic/teichoic acid biosynthesis glycosyltransferase